MTTIFDIVLGQSLVNLASYDANRYTNEIYNAAAQFWKDGNKGGFTTRMNGTIKFGLQSAFENGASEVDVLPDEFSDADKAFIAGIITEEKSHVSDLLKFIDGLANDPKGKLSDAAYRLEMWAKRYPDVTDRGKIHFGGKRRLAWVLGQAEHCESCIKLSKITAWAIDWETAGIKPKDSRLKCHGYNCACQMVETTTRRSPKALDKINAIVAGLQ